MERQAHPPETFVSVPTRITPPSTRGANRGGISPIYLAGFSTEWKESLFAALGMTPRLAELSRKLTSRGRLGQKCVNRGNQIPNNSSFVHKTARFAALR